MSFPRTLLLTSWAPDARYAGAENLRRILGELPPESVCWCGLRSIKPGGESSTRRSVPIRDVHWRLKGSIFEYLYVHEWQAKSLAQKMAREIRDFQPQALWVLPELAAIPVAIELGRLLNIPIHATVYDSLESARELCVPALYYPRYMGQVRRLFKTIQSFDTVSPGLRDHVMRTYGCKSTVGSLVFPPSVPESWMEGGEMIGVKGSSLRRIAFCGAMRCSTLQWQGFLDQLAASPFQFEFHAYAWRDSVPEAKLPDNVRIEYQAYVEDERELVRQLQSRGYDACYLALWQAQDRHLFARTSLSSKLTTYVAAGLPVIYHGPVASEAWRLISKYNAGILISEDQGGAGILANLFSDRTAWQQMAAGASCLCHEVFNLDRNILEFAEAIDRLARRSPSG
jgi:hypothetical protein